MGTSESLLSQHKIAVIYNHVVDNERLSVVLGVFDTDEEATAAIKKDIATKTDLRLYRRISLG